MMTLTTSLPLCLYLSGMVLTATYLCWSDFLDYTGRKPVLTSIVLFIGVVLFTITWPIFWILLITLNTKEKKMKIFTMSLRKLFSQNKRESLAPADILFESQLPFLRRNFGSYLKSVENNKDGTAVFKCQIPASECLQDFRKKVFNAEWGDFEPKSMSLSVEDCYRGPVRILVNVGLSKRPAAC